MAEYHSDNNSGCGCLVVLAICGFIVYTCSNSDGDKKKETSLEQQNTETYNTIESEMDTGPILDELTEEDKQYLSNSLNTGATPYIQFYGKNYRCPKEQCSGINVTAPRESDIVVIIKKDNSSGKVISHGYIRSGATCFFPIPDGTYQTFFYYGEGWNPNKEMANGIRGGFVQKEIYSKDEPQDIYNGILTYVLQLQSDGNFQTQGSNKMEVF